jgi:SAM-dependent methyltransferase
MKHGEYGVRHAVYLISVKSYWTTLFFTMWLSSSYLNGQQPRHIRFQDLPAGWAESESSFNRAIAELERRTRERLLEGENDHLIAYLLQSARFTTEPKIEPALSAMEYMRANAPAGPVPAAVAWRMDRFLKARPGDDVRLAYFQRLVAGRGKPYLIAEYARTMRFLYEKESGQTKNLPPADLYQERGYATDTQVEANFAVWTALSVLKSLQPGLRTDRILIVGPGLDLAPRTGLIDLFPPQSYQPFAVADAALSLGLARRERLRVHALDINPMVVGFFRDFSRRAGRRLNLISGLRRDQLSSDFQDYFRQLGRQIGSEERLELPPALAAHLGKSVAIRQEVAQAVTAAAMNILTERYDPSPKYDLVVAANILVYFNAQELRLALANICSMLRPGGYLVHNEVRPELEEFGLALGLVPVQARTIQLSAGAGKPLFDSLIIQRRN